MPTIKVFRDTSGKVINIGDWDYGPPLMDMTDPENPKPILDQWGNPDVPNPLPEGTSEAEEEFVVNADGSRSVVDANQQPDPYRISKTTPWLRMTDEEAASMDVVMSETSARLKQIYMASTYLASNDPLWQTLHQMLVDTFGAERADELLAPEI